MNKVDVTFCKCNCHSFALYLPYASLHHTLLDLCMYLMVQSYLWQMVHTQSVDELAFDILEGSTGRGRSQALRGNEPPPPPLPPVDIAQMLPTQNNLMTTQNDLIRRMVENDECRGAGRSQHPRQ
jgi:hypothetical protein